MRSLTRVMSEPRDVEAARTLGWASIGIGLAELLMSKQIEKVMGIGNGEHKGILRTLEHPQSKCSV